MKEEQFKRECAKLDKKIELFFNWFLEYTHVDFKQIKTTK